MSDNEVIGYISAIQTLVDNFPLNLLEWLSAHGKKYNSVIDFLLDVIFGILTTIDIKNGTSTVEDANSAIEKFFFDIIEKIVGVNKSFVMSIDSINDDELESKTFNKIEDAIKGAIVEILTALLSCSAIPEIKTENMDKSGGYNDNGTPIQRISVPVQVIDMFNKLKINPNGEVGRTYYDIGSEHYMPSTMYKTHDLDAFMWYVLNRGNEKTQTEINKMMWDNRRNMKYYPDYSRESATDSDVNGWGKWLNSKKIETDELIGYGDSGKNNKNKESDKLFNNGVGGNRYFPILQFYPNFGGANARLDVLFPAQRYHNELKENDRLKKMFQFNHTMYKFNWDYINSIRIFSVRTILAGLVNGLVNGFWSSMAMSQYSLNISAQYVTDQVTKTIKNLIEADDMNIEECMFNFSNEDYDKMLYQRDLDRFGLQTYNPVNGNVTYPDKDSITDTMNNITSSAILTQTNVTIPKQLYNLAATAQTAPRLEVQVQFTSNYMQMLYNFLMCLIMPIVGSLLSPKIILLFILNFQVAGFIDIEKLLRGDTTEITALIYNKIFSIIKILIVYLKDVIVAALMEKLGELLSPLLTKYCLSILLENTADWLRLIEEALKCLPVFNMSIPKLLNQLDDVNYADIDSTLHTPESKSNC